MRLKLIGVGIAVVSSFAVLPGEALAEKIYWNPRIDGLEVDRCITSHQYPDGCSEGATEHAATTFCRHNGYSHATSWSWQD